MVGTYIFGGLLVLLGLSLMLIGSVGKSRGEFYCGFAVALVAAALLVVTYSSHEQREEQRRRAQIHRLLRLDYPNLEESQITDDAEGLKFHGGANDEATCWPWIEVSDGKLKFNFEQQEGTSSRTTCEDILVAAR